MPTIPYHQRLTTKIFCARKRTPAVTTFAEAGALIRQIHALTAGCPQVVYLVGWQHDGHDSKYPDWTVVNQRLAPGEDALAALRALMIDARRFNAVVSLHINMDDAYADSPVWDRYKDANLLIRETDGTLSDAGVWDDDRCHWVSKTHEWRAGLAQQRIDALCALLPLGEQGTVHIDAFRPHPSPWHGTTWADEVATCRALIGHWRSHGIDVTTEYLADPALADLHPLVWHDNRDESERLAIPPEVLCGGGAAANCRGRRISEGEPPWWGWSMAPSAGCRYDEAWGASIDCDVAMRPEAGFADPLMVQREFTAKTLPWLRFNRTRPIRHEQTAGQYTVHFADGLESRIRTSDRHHRVTDADGRVLLDGGDRCLPCDWRPGCAMAVHAAGGPRTWELENGWAGVGSAAVSCLTMDGAQPLQRVPVSDGAITLDLAPGVPVLIEPA